MSRFSHAGVIPQPLTGFTALFAGMCFMTGAWARLLDTHANSLTIGNLALASVLVLGIGGAQRFPIHVRQESKIVMATVPLYLAVVLMPTALGTTTICLGMLCLEKVGQNQKGGLVSDGASQIGRWVAIGGIASVLTHAMQPHMQQSLALIAGAVTLWVLDILTVPSLLSPIMHVSPWRIIGMATREGGPTEAAQYLIGILGSLAYSEARWSLVLLFLPTALVYRAFKSVKDMRESSRRLLMGVVETSRDAIALLGPDNRILIANQEAARLFGFWSPDAMLNIPVYEVVGHDQRDVLTREIEDIQGGEDVPASEYCVTRPDGSERTVEFTWSLVKDESQRRTAVTFVARDVTSRKLAEEALEHRAMHDALTGLPNRFLLQEKITSCIERQQRDGTPFALFLLDLNEFKQVNDTYGHKAGDDVLREISRRLLRALRDTDTVTRLGGDEFAIVLPTAEVGGARLVAERIVESVSTPVASGEHLLRVGASIGISLCPSTSDVEDELFHQADIAMYSAKRHGGGFEFFSMEERLADSA